MEYLRSNFRPIQSLDNRQVFKSAVKDAWLPDLTDGGGGGGGGPYGSEASKGDNIRVLFTVNDVEMQLALGALGALGRRTEHRCVRVCCNICAVSVVLAAHAPHLHIVP